MTSRTTRFLALVAALPLVLSTAGVVTATGDAAPGSARKGVTQSKRIVVKWNAAKHKRHPVYQKTADVPGIGQVDLICQPDTTMIKLHANDRRAETQMWLAKFETKDGTDRVAVKNVRIYTYATASDDGKGGTGPQAHEGLNQGAHGIEDFQKGSAYGVISQRPGRDRDAGGSLAVPATAFKLTWYWERFAYPGSQYCKMTLALKTDTDQQFGLNWHGTPEATSHTTSSTTIPGFGKAELTCEPDTGDTEGRQSVALRLDSPDPDAYMDYTYLQSEGSTNDPKHYEVHTDLQYDPVTGLLGPVDLPRNGMMRIKWHVNGVSRTWVLSSYMVTNNDERPWLNVCEVAAAPLP
ncbi:hypothetical protein ABLE68_05000 [Nocardioides sp. CN2-186]|uniref:hypothetical protein n=1 Tax=Nocardioides tweenelious TaxID=3156607 RepID=UPI0032B4AAD6